MENRCSCSGCPLCTLRNKLEKAENGIMLLKSLIKKHPAGWWSEEYKELADAIHTLGRETLGIE